jgi:hypothetical protein
MTVNVRCRVEELLLPELPPTISSVPYVDSLAFMRSVETLS